MSVLPLFERCGMKRLYKNRKRIICITLCCITLSMSLYHAYNNAKEVQAFAVVDDIAYILMILAACGAGYAGYQWNASGGREEFENQLLNAGDTLKRMWDETARKQASGEIPTGYDPNDFDPDNDDPNDKIPSWDKFKEWFKKHSDDVVGLGTVGVGGVLGAMKNKIDDLQNKNDAEVVPLPLESIPNCYRGYSSCGTTNPSVLATYNESILNDTYAICGTSNSGSYVALAEFPSEKYNSLYFTIPSSGNMTGVSFGAYNFENNWQSYFNSGNALMNGTGWYNSLGVRSFLGDVSEPFYISPLCDIYAIDRNTGEAVLYDSPLHYDNITKDNTIKGTDLKDNVKPELPDSPLFDNLRLPTQEEIDKYIQDLENLEDTGDDDEERKRVVVDEFIHNITNVTDNPNPDPEPDPGPDPDPTPDPNPDPEPDPNPEPEPELEPGSLEFDFKLLFPFCVPFDLIDTIKVLDAEPQAPCIDIPFPYLTDKGLKTEKLTIDLSKYDDIALLMRRCELLLFIIGLILLTRNIIRG